MTEKQYYRHFTSIIHRAKKTKSIFKALETIISSSLIEQDKQDIYSVWLHLRKEELKEQLAKIICDSQEGDAWQDLTNGQKLFCYSYADQILSIIK